MVEHLHGALIKRRWLPLPDDSGILGHLERKGCGGPDDGFPSRDPGKGLRQMLKSLHRLLNGGSLLVRDVRTCGHVLDGLEHAPWIGDHIADGKHFLHRCEDGCWRWNMSLVHLGASSSQSGNQ